MRTMALQVTLLGLLAGAAPGAQAAGPPVATFSIVGYDPVTGDLGIAVQSKFFAVGAVVPWARAGVGAIATQSFANTTYGPRGLALLALASLLPRCSTRSSARMRSATSARWASSMPAAAAPPTPAAPA